MCTVIVSTPGSGRTRTFSPFARRYSVTPSTEAAFCGASAASATQAASARSRAAENRFMPANRSLLLLQVLAHAAQVVLARLALAGRFGCRSFLRALDLLVRILLAVGNLGRLRAYLLDAGGLVLLPLARLHRVARLGGLRVDGCAARGEQEDA